MAAFASAKATSCFEGPQAPRPRDKTHADDATRTESFKGSFFYSFIRSVQPFNQDCSIRTIAQFEAESNSYLIILIGRKIHAYESFADELNVFRIDDWLEHF